MENFKETVREEEREIVFNYANLIVPALPILQVKNCGFQHVSIKPMSA